MISAYIFFNDALSQFFSLQENSTYFTQLAANSDRIASVLRGATGIVSASSNDLVVYAYFSPDDTYVSKIHYYLNSSGTELLADVTQMTSDPPIGTPIASTTKTYTIISNYYQLPNVSLFDYLAQNGSTLSEPITNLQSIKGIRVNLSVPSSYSKGGQTLSVRVTLRNMEGIV